MRVQQFRRTTAVAALALAAGLTLTACNSNDKSDGGRTDDAARSTPSTSASSDGSATEPGSGATDGEARATDGGARATVGHQGNSGAMEGSSRSRAAANARAACKTANLTFAKGSSVDRGDYTDIAVKLTNSGSATCFLHGFPGVDLVGKDGRVSARRGDHKPGTVTLAPGRSARFELRVLRNKTGGSGVTFTSAVITPPDETHAHTLPLSVNLPVQEDGAGTDSVVVGPVTP
ncbi:DUF4232 domain-containing protein [Streptomyces sp. RY43-2]|uniref:DUF4232 domain-containing protein n=1 Tax=Streptomyces macrolidinus TaxID=2952607 RepID=A0ABT0ZDB5_9ACTN|nr:DUF4232 domain-containing protein [Streptomyces macrolidinus]MCN9241551.1 DUF4232 domain-containing protein [Streptomyces macrolidinus]